MFTMKKVVFIACLSTLLVGCDKSVEDKPIPELTSEEADGICKSPEILTQLENSFKKETIDDLKKNPRNYSPFSDRYKRGILPDTNERRTSRIDVNYSYTSEDFSKGFGTTDKLTITNPTINGTGTDSLKCSAKVQFSSDEMYGLTFANDIIYNVKKDNGKYVTDTSISFDDLLAHKIEPTASQKSWRDKYEEKLNANENVIRDIPDSEFKNVTQNDLYYIYFSQSPRTFSDDELMGFFSTKWNSTTDVFAKEDIKKEELQKIKEKISQYKDLKNILGYSSFSSNNQLNEKYGVKIADGEKPLPSTDGWVSASDSYDMSKKGFKYNAAFCAMTGGLMTENRGINFTIDQALRGCTVGVPDDKAREVSAKLADLHSKRVGVSTFVKSYIHIDNVDGNTNTIHATLVRDEVKVVDSDNGEIIIDTVVR